MSSVRGHRWQTAPGRGKVVAANSGDEFSHDAYAVFREYKGLYEAQMAAHLAELGLDLPGFLLQANEVPPTQSLSRYFVVLQNVIGYPVSLA